MIEDLDNQASKLRELAAKAEKERRLGLNPDIVPAQPLTPSGRVSERKVPYTIAVTSGKGGVGKTLVSVNMAIHFAAQGLKVLIIDADLGLANIDVVLGLSPEHTIEDVIAGRLSLDDVALPGPPGITILPAASGVAELADMNDEQRMSLLDHIDRWNADFDVVIVDTGAGISPNVRYFVLSVEKILVVATPDPASVTDAYALMKVMNLNHRLNNFDLVVNQVESARQAKEVYRTLHQVADRFLNLGLGYAGHIPSDGQLVQAVRQQKPVSELYPDAEASKAFGALTETLMRAWRQGRDNDGRATLFWRRILDDNTSTTEGG
ncbi:MinD/ParA family protein [Magnetofaba australis]|uniref:Putative cobyrinic acid a,c-diamide synthase n=1 Tax=Magnetofaba australis IT-1 TaxID=1434232 RepID=A0A1Y2K290_9PROT|nr:MinD/ParA family protein [Magnetofaba australis]OSM02069.1 putative cobyrinic acid a,c-diamide synthase [Magnetofaba australis IT-1]